MQRDQTWQSNLPQVFHNSTPVPLQQAQICARDYTCSVAPLAARVNLYLQLPFPPLVCLCL